ncbi:hypothetical protein ACQPZZ_01915 [Microbispora sp. CA-135349]|uniref:hypothetical protein n=1 Tax=Microbispora sp. CA-135349 TaxID=3239953 RepID=UPI003D94B5CD
MKPDIFVEFAALGRLRSLSPGMSRSEVFKKLGRPDGSTSGFDADPYYAWCYEDLELGLTAAHHRVSYIAIEPRGAHAELPALVHAGRVMTPRRDCFLATLRALKLTLGECEPFVPGESWWRVSESGVVLRFDDDGLLEAIHASDKQLSIQL